jgi:hypothetical protein
MADDELAGFDRLRDRFGGLERLVDRLDERMISKLGKDDATTLMEYSAEGDKKLREEFLGRLSDFRTEVRDAFKHNERETSSSIYKATTESEGRLTTAIAALSAAIAQLNQPQHQEQRRGWHPVVTYGGSGAGIATIAGVLLYLLTQGRLG